MPGGNRTGPLGQGPRTGRGAGFCAGNESPGFTNPPFGGRGAGRGRGGRGWRHQFYATGLNRWQRGAAWTQDQELSALQADLEQVERRAAELRRRIEALHAKQPQDAAMSDS